ncbi:MAG TPA: fimbria/pilus outer membrane usher protein [Ramlibacter sp.]|nr:fimbria/pilus outer membrane usher protein [Ramlibacter sp.]
MTRGPANRRIVLLLQLALAAMAMGSAAAQVAPPGPAAVAMAGGQVEELILTIRSNGVPRGEFLLLRAAGGDFLIREQDVQRLAIQPPEGVPAHAFAGDRYLSLRELGSRRIELHIEELALDLEFPATSYGGTRIDLANRPEPLPIETPANSVIVNYRASVRDTGDAAPLQLRLSTDLNVRMGDVLLRQEALARTREPGQPGGFVRGPTQLLIDDRREGTRLIVGDTVVGASGTLSAFTGAGVSFAKLFAITPDVVYQPSPHLQVFAPTPSEVAVSVDGSTVYRAQVGPGPVALDNLLYWGGSRSVQVTVTDASGRTQVVEQPFLFTDRVLARGQQEYSYFLGRRSEIGSDLQLRYREAAWQGFHRYGVTDWLTASGTAEGNRDFTAASAGATLRADRLGLISADLLYSTDRINERTALGWGARYTWEGPTLGLFLGHRRFGDGFRTYSSYLGMPAIRREDRLGASVRLTPTTSLSADATRVSDALGGRNSMAVRMVTSFSRRASLQTEYVIRRTGAGPREWGVNLYLRFDLDGQVWASTSASGGPGNGTLNLEAGRQLTDGEGVGWRAGTQSQFGDHASHFGYASANWNLRPFSLDFNGSSQLTGGRARFVELGISGAVVAVDGFAGLSRRVNDSFALARLGVPEPGVDIYLNNQWQGKSDEQGNLVIPQVGAYGRQDVSINDRQLPMQYGIAHKRMSIAPAFKSGSVVDFGGRRQRAFIGLANAGPGPGDPIRSRAFPMARVGATETVRIETSPAGEFYLENAEPGRYAGTLDVDGRKLSCRLELPDDPEVVIELKEGVTCD